MLIIELLLDISLNIAVVHIPFCFDQRPQVEVRVLNKEDQRRWFPCQRGPRVSYCDTGETVMYETMTWVRACRRIAVMKVFGKVEVNCVFWENEGYRLVVRILLQKLGLGLGQTITFSTD